MKLYSYWRSSSSWRVRIALAHKGLVYQYHPIHLIRDGGEQNTEAYRALNPARTVPLLEETDGGKVWRLSQSMAILEYLEERFPRPPLLPSDPRARGRVRQYAELINSGIQPLHNRAVTDYVKNPVGGDDKAWGKHWIARGLEALEQEVAETAGRFCFGDEPSFADVYLVPQLFGARRFEVDVSRYPRLLRIEATAAALPAFQVTHPDRQPDAER
jgi:maleylpyruvate isomerase